MRIIVGSASPRKVEVCRAVFARFLGSELCVEGLEVASGVPETPFEAETFVGARNRALACRRQTQGDFFVGIESGLAGRFGAMYEEAWSCVIDRAGREYCGYSSGLRVPDAVLEEMNRSGLPHAAVMAAIEARRQLPHDTWSNYSGRLIRRETSLEESLRNAVIQIAAGPDSLYRQGGQM